MKRILVYGDSNSYGTAPFADRSAMPPHPRGVRWPDRMAIALGARFEVIVEGLPGRTSVLDDPMEGTFRNGLTVLPAVLHTHEPIDLLVVCLGTNDQKSRFGLHAIDVALGLRRLLRTALATGAVTGQSLLIAPPQVRERGVLAEMFAGAESRVGVLGPHLAPVAEELEIGFFDAGAVIAVDPLDGVHWSAEAHAKLGAALAEVVVRLDM